MDAISSSLAGMAYAARRFDRASSDIVQSASGVSDAPVERAVVEQISAGQQMKASSATVRAAQQMYGALLDILV